jgi:protein-L-isoaspartate(D-aspartate) O-methyltransferase
MKPPNAEQARHIFAALMADASRSSDPRLETIVESVPREAFLGPGPWKIVSGHRYVETPDDNPAYLYQNVLVALDADRQINNGEPFLHARWIGYVRPQPGEVVTHIGAGTGYYTALLSKLVEPGGHVHAFEIDPRLAAWAKRNLEPYPNVTVLAADAVTHPLAPSDVIYVNAGVAELPAGWLAALNPGGRLVFPWCPARDTGLALLVTARESGFDVDTQMPVAFIPCRGTESSAQCSPELDLDRLKEVRSIHRIADRRPDETAVAVYGDLWFSTDSVPTG